MRLADRLKGPEHSGGVPMVKSGERPRTWSVRRTNPVATTPASARLRGSTLLGFIAFLAASVASTALAFEGELTAKLSGAPGSFVRIHAWYSETGDVRIDTAGKSADGELMRGSIYMPAKGASYYSASHNQKVIVETSYASLRDPSADVAGNAREAELEVKKLGSETISGVPTEHVRVLDKDNNATIDLWMTPDYPPDLWTQAFRGRNLGLELSDDERTKAMVKYGIQPGFSMKMRVRQPGRPSVEFLVEDIKRTAVPPQVFTLPSGYKRVMGAAEPAAASPAP